MSMSVTKPLLAAATFLLCLLIFAPARGQEGWLLMRPPLDLSKLMSSEQTGTTAQESFREAIDSGAPIHAWDQVSAYDSASECETAKITLTEESRVEARKWENDKTWRTPMIALYFQMMLSRCVPASVLYPPKQ